MRTALLTAVSAFALASPLSAATIAYVVPSGTAGNQSYTSILGMTFEVNTSISVDSLGAFDADGDGLSAGTTLVTELWSRTGTSGDAILASVSFDVATPGTLIGGSIFASITPLMLTPGDYAIVSFGYNANDQNGNKGTGGGSWTTNSGGGALTFTGGGQFEGTPGASIGDRIDGGPGDRYAAGTFSFTVVPIPATLPLGLGALAMVGSLSLRRGKGRHSEAG